MSLGYDDADYRIATPRGSLTGSLLGGGCRGRGDGVLYAESGGLGIVAGGCILLAVGEVEAVADDVGDAMAASTVRLNR